MRIPALLMIAALSVPLVSACSNTSVDPPPVYVHMNGNNEFLEPLVFVRPEQAVIFVNEDTGMHTIVGYNPANGSVERTIDGNVRGTAGPGHSVATYRVALKKEGTYAYYCSVHAVLQKTYGGAVQPAHRRGVHGFEGSMGGTIVVTDDAALLRANPPTTARKILSHFFGG